MTCEKCRSFGGTRSNYEYLGINISRHAELYQCKHCGQFLEIVAEARAPSFLALEQAKEHFPDARKALEKNASRKREVAD
ncbi:hypothetical protein [Burkholderia sp. Ac-20349]|nr:hypothetical protein [Burkholderia sp. Ac-20349]MBN3841900.1 hypothetical protein [Burkholderia sp. Ac-20349]